MVSVCDLPYEILEHIMSFMSHADKKTARLVCRYWREVSYSPKLVTNQIVKVSKYRDLNELTEHERIYLNLKIDGEDEEEDAVEFWRRFGQHVKSLDMCLLNHCITEVFPNTPNLEEMKLWESEASRLPVVPFNFQKLLSLALKFVELTGDVFGMLVDNAPRLQELSLTMRGWRIKPDLADALEAFINRQGKILQKLHFSHVRVQNVQLTKILSNIGPQIVELHLPDCSDLTDAFLPVIKQKMPNLKRLNLRWTKCTDEGIHDLLRELKNLTHIELKRSWVGERTAQLLPNLAPLCAVDLSDTQNFDDHCVRRAFGTKHLPLLTDLRMSESGEWLAVTDQILAEILPFLPNLKNLHLRHFKNLSNSAVRHISNLCQHLRVLSLTHSFQIRNISPLNNLQDLEYLSVRGCRITISADKPLRLRKLKEIVLNSRNNNNAVIKTLAKNCPSLQNVYFDMVDTRDSREQLVNSHHFQSHYVNTFGNVWWEERSIFGYKSFV